MLSIGAGQFIRLGKSLILTRLLFPEAYGVMAIVWSLLFTLSMLSDAGLSAAAVRHKRGNDPQFLNTIWTMRAIRGFLLFLLTCLIAYPASIFYGNRDLLWLVPAAGLTVLIEGFGSTNLYTLQREMQYKRITTLELTSEIIGFFVTLIWAKISPGVEALMGGAIVVAICRMLGTHFILPGIKNKFEWDATAFQEIFQYGKWIFFSSIVFLIYTQGDRIILGRLFDPATLGVYSIAIMLSEAVSTVINKLNGTVLFPALSRVINSEQYRLREVYYKTRLGTDFLIVIPVCILMIIAGEVVSILYDSRYHDAGWMLQILCIRLLMVALLASSDMCLLALGHSKYSLIQNAARASWILIGIPIAWHFYDVIGVLWVVSLTELPVFFVLWYGMKKNNILSPKYEMRSIVSIVAGLILGIGILHLYQLLR